MHFENRLILITHPDDSTSEYVYDGVGKRVQTEEEGKVSKFLYDGWNVIVERDENDDTVAAYTRGLSYGGGIGGIISCTTLEGTSYYHYDGIGTVTELTDVTGNIAQSYTYDAYGNLLSVEGNAINPYHFSAKEFSPKSRLVYFGARHYDSRVGRFITRDPSAWGPDDLRIFENPNTRRNQIVKALISVVGVKDPRNFHPYMYCHNNPSNYVDPLGYTSGGFLLSVLGVVTDVASTASGVVGQVAGFLGTIVSAISGVFTVAEQETRLEETVQPGIDRDQQLLNDISTDLGGGSFRLRGINSNPGYSGDDTRVRPSN